MKNMLAYNNTKDISKDSLGSRQDRWVRSKSPKIISNRFLIKIHQP